MMDHAKKAPRRAVKHYVLFDRIDIQDANAISSPITYGFPAVSGFLGAVHSLNRDIELGHPGIVGEATDSKLPPDIAENMNLDGVLITCHDYRLHCYRPHRYADYTFNQTRNPIKKNGETASIIEQGRINLTISLVVEIASSGRSSQWLNSERNQKLFSKILHHRLMQKRIAGGSVTSIRQTALFMAGFENEILKCLLPGFVLNEARGELESITRELQTERPDATAFDALIDLATLHHEPPEHDRNDASNAESAETRKWTTKNRRQGRGWLVPMAMGYQSISPEFGPNELENASFPHYPSQYVEVIYGLGKWVFPTKVASMENSFWRYQAHQPDPQNHPDYRLYLGTQSKK